MSFNFENHVRVISHGGHVNEKTGCVFGPVSRLHALEPRSRPMLHSHRWSIPARD